MNFRRECGILLHPTSLPSKYGIGDLGKEAYRFIDFLYKSRQKLWQILPLNPVGYGYSPYQSPSAFAGNPLLISIDKLVEERLLESKDLRNLPPFDNEKVLYNEVILFKETLYKKAFKNFKGQEKSTDYDIFLKNNYYWLFDFALFTALKKHFQKPNWNCWEDKIVKRDPQTLNYYNQLLEEEIKYQYFLQYIFYKQWSELKRYANDKGIKIIGDLPIYVSHDSSDTWSNPHLFQLDEEGNPLVVAGVPPDYFSETGQLWGNPIYDWNVMEEEDFKWWRERVNNLFKLVDIIRIDHFRGFEAYWEIPAGEKTAVNGRWVKAPGYKLFSTLKKYFNSLPVIAEDLGVITPEVEELKKEFNFPGMKVMQFAFESCKYEEFAPEYHEKNLVVYTGTHDNNTILGWFKNISQNNSKVLQVINNYYHLDTAPVNNDEICWRFIETAYKSNANTVIIPLQDVLCLGRKARMNTPGTLKGNWQWRYSSEMLKENFEDKLSFIADIYNR